MMASRALLSIRDDLVVKCMLHLEGSVQVVPSRYCLAASGVARKLIATRL
jgi:hypothetical protein